MSEKTGATLFVRGISVTKFPWENLKPAVISCTITVSNAAKGAKPYCAKEIALTSGDFAVPDPPPFALPEDYSACKMVIRFEHRKPGELASAIAHLTIRVKHKQFSPPTICSATCDLIRRGDRLSTLTIRFQVLAAGTKQKPFGRRAPVRAVSISEKTVANRDHDENPDPREVTRMRATTASLLTLVPQQYLTAFGDAEFIRDMIAAFLGQNEAAGAMQMSVRENPSQFAVGSVGTSVSASETDPYDSYFNA
jgi:hypothetical protein